MSKFTDDLHAFFSKFFSVAKADLDRVEKAVEDKMEPLLISTKEDVEASLAALRADLTDQVNALKTKIDAFFAAHSDDVK